MNPLPETIDPDTISDEALQMASAWLCYSVEKEEARSDPENWQELFKTAHLLQELAPSLKPVDPFEEAALEFWKADRIGVTHAGYLTILKRGAQIERERGA